MSNPLVTVIIPVYNTEKFLRQCINSVLTQSYKNIEILLVDDGSTDSCRLICDSYNEKYPSISVIHKKNAGLGMARNTGLEFANGEYVFLLDSDDYIEKNVIEFQMNQLKKYDVDTCYVGYTAVNENGDYLYNHSYKDEVFVGKDVCKKLLPRLLGSTDGDYNDRIEMSAANQLYSMVPIRKHHLRFVSERDYISEDLVFNIDYLSVSNGVCTSSNIGCYYRQNQSSLSHKYNPNRFEQFKIFYTYITEKLKNYDFSVRDRNRLDKTFLIQVRSSICSELLKDGVKFFFNRNPRVKEICLDPLVQEIAWKYPINNMKKIQRIYVYLLRKKMFNLLSILLFFWILCK